MATCTSCGAAIEWARTVNGRPIPVDVGEVGGGNLVIIGQRAQVVADGSGNRVSHFASCPNAKQHRRPR